MTTDQQRIHHVPTDVEAPPPTPPLVPRGSFQSEKNNPIPQMQQVPFRRSIDVEAPPPTRPLIPRGSVPSEKTNQIPQMQQVPFRRTIPLVPPPLKPPKKGSCWCKCLCWTISILILLLIIFGATIGIIYLVFQPKLPKYSVDNLRISDLTLNFDLSLYARFNVRITAENPNKKIGIYYERGSHLSVWYKNTNLCQGSVPRFYQGHQNKTVLNVALTGQNQYGSTLLQALQEEQQTGRIPLDLKIDVPVILD